MVHELYIKLLLNYLYIKGQPGVTEMGQIWAAGSLRLHLPESLAPVLHCASVLLRGHGELAARSRSTMCLGFASDSKVWG